MVPARDLIIELQNMTSHQREVSNSIYSLWMHYFFICFVFVLLHFYISDLLQVFGRIAGGKRIWRYIVGFTLWYRFPGTTEIMIPMRNCHCVSGEKSNICAGNLVGTTLAISPTRFQPPTAFNIVITTASSWTHTFYFSLQILITAASSWAVPWFLVKSNSTHVHT